MALEDFIADCVARRNARLAREEEERIRRDQDLQALRQAVIASLRQRVRAAIPLELRPFASYAGPQPTLEQLTGYPDRWTPSDFKVEAPGLNLILFKVRADNGEAPMIVTQISVGSEEFGEDWFEAVAAAVVTTGVRR